MPVHRLPEPLPPICIALSASTPELLFASAERALADSPFLEFRLDSLPQPASALPGLRQFLKRHPSVICIATCRRTPDGGNFTGTATEEIALLNEAALAGAHLIDLPLEAAESLSATDLASLRHTGTSLLLSHHDFVSTSDLESLLARALPFAPDFVKLVSTAARLTDNLGMLRFLEQHRNARPRLVGITMGEAGLLSRVLGPAFGSAFTFAAPSVGSPTAPGQVTARTLRDRFRLPSLSREVRVFGVAGHPLQHSLSPLMLNAAFAHWAESAVYLPLPGPDLPDLLRLVHELPVSGLSVTMPHKQAILPHLDELSPLARNIGACNTVLRSTSGSLFGENTDVAGILTPLEKRLGSVRDTRVLVLGGGGAARAAVFGLIAAGAQVSLLNRTATTAARLADEAGADVVTRADLRSETFDILINATPLGMSGHTESSPLLSEECRGRLAFDLVYNPLDTPFLETARQAGLKTIGGYEMFVYQGARQFELWTGQPAPESVMLQVVLEALHHRQHSHGSGVADAPSAAQRTS